MKKYLYPLLFMAVAIFSATALVACGGDDEDEPTPEPTPVAKNYATYEGKFAEAFFDYFNVSVSFEYDNQTVTYNYDENTKKDVIELNIPEWLKDDKRPGRELIVKPFEYTLHPVKCTHNFELTEAGKQKIANATTEEIDLAFFINCFKCNENGGHVYTSDAPNTFGAFGFNGVPVKGIENFIAEQESKGRLSKTLK